MVIQTPYFNNLTQAGRITCGELKFYYYDRDSLSVLYEKKKLGVFNFNVVLEEPSIFNQCYMK